MKKKLFLLSLIVAMLLSSCAGINVDEDTKSFVDLFYSVYTPQDTMFGLYMDTMYDVATVLSENEDKKEEKLTKAMEKAVSLLTEAQKKIKETSISGIVLDKETENFMDAKGLDVKELTGIAEIAKSNQTFYLEAIDVLLYSLNEGVPEGEVELEDVIVYAAYQHQLIYLYVQYDYYTLNGFFAPLSKDEIRYVKSYMKNKSVVFGIDGVEWQDSQENAVVEANLIWQAIEEFVGE